MKLVMAQWDGFAQGIGQFATPEQLAILSPASLYLLCSVGDLETINGLVRDDPLPTPSLATEDALPCSGLISVMTTADGAAAVGVTDVFAAQATWRSYYAMLRIYKVYAFEYYPQKVLTIASSPGLLHSKVSGDPFSLCGHLPAQSPMCRYGLIEKVLPCRMTFSRHRRWS